ncbi:hypothetical protein BDV96DRAFT_233189 [Lophiotrema nucula]|uniref:Uncharacterized protein n=1 Tax=Lophiotrema nucula TaxID=690887 RepID=A0A6A5YUC4_9PLEO|nr:hypothetical protein BDV96DRAFT_233189 [Lophiotrema nucula]
MHHSLVHFMDLVGVNYSSVKMIVSRKNAGNFRVHLSRASPAQPPPPNILSLPAYPPSSSNPLTRQCPRNASA